MERSDHGLSELDQAILRDLTRDPFASSKAVADGLGITPSLVASRLRSLERRGVSHVIAVLDMVRMGQSFCFIQIEVFGNDLASVGARIGLLREVLMVSELSGGDADLLVLLRFADVVTLNASLYGRIAKIEGVRSWRVDIVVNVPVFRSEYVTFTSDFLPVDYQQSVADLREDLPLGVCDDLDLQLIAYLQQNAIQSINDVARRLDMSASTVRYRLNNLKSSGILRFIRIIDHSAVGIEAFALVELDVDLSQLDAVVAALHNRPWLPQLFVCAGRRPIMGIVIARDEAAILRIKRDELVAIPGVKGVTVSRLHRTLSIDFRWSQEAA